MCAVPTHNPLHKPWDPNDVREEEKCTCKRQGEHRSFAVRAGEEYFRLWSAAFKRQGEYKLFGGRVNDEPKLGVCVVSFCGSAHPKDFGDAKQGESALATRTC